MNERKKQLDPSAVHKCLPHVRHIQVHVCGCVTGYDYDPKVDRYVYVTECPRHDTTRKT